MKLVKIIIVIAFVLFQNDAESVPTTTSSLDLKNESTASTTPTPSDSSEEGTSTDNSKNEEGVLIIFDKRDNSSDTDLGDGDTKGISVSKRETDRLSQSNNDKDEDDKASGDEDNFNSTSKETTSSNSSSTPEIILVPFFRPRPFLIDIIIFRVNDTNFNQTGPHFPSHSGGQGVGHSKPINSDEDSTGGSTTTAQDITSSSTSSPDNDMSTRKLSSSEEVTHTPSFGKNSSSQLTHNRGRRDTIFSHFTNNSQTTTSSIDDDGKMEKEPTFSSSDSNNNDNQDNANSSSVSTSPTPSWMTTGTILILSALETNNGSTENNEPQFGVGPGTNEESDKKSTMDTTPNTTTTANPVISIFMEIIQYGENVTKALFGKVDDNNNANSKRRNHLESSGAGNDGNDHDMGISHTTGSNFTTITAFTLFPPLLSSSTSSNQNSTNHNLHPQNGSDSPVQEK